MTERLIILSASGAPTPPVATAYPWRRTVIVIVVILVIVLGSVTGFLVYAASTSSAVVTKKNFSYPEQPGESPNSTSITVVNVNGNIKLVTWTQTGILINGTVTARGLNAIPDNVLIVESHDSNGDISLYAQFPSQGGFSFFQNYDVSIMIFAPSDLSFKNVKIGTINGAVSVQSINAQLLGLTTTNGDIIFHCETCGNTTATTTNGSVTGTFGSPILNGTYAFATVNGSVDVIVPAASSIKFDGKTTNGSVTTRSLAFTNLTAQTLNHLSGSIGLGSATMVFSSVNGSVAFTGS